MNTTTRTFSFEEVIALATERAALPLWIGDDGPRTWADFAAELAAARQECVRTGLVPGSVVIVPGEPRLESLAWLFAVALAGSVAAPLRREREGELASWRSCLNVDGQVRDGRLVGPGQGTNSPTARRLLGELTSQGRAGLILATGGTAGQPKLVLHDLGTLLAAIPLRNGRPVRLLPLMRFDHIGGLDMAWRALAGGQVIVAPPAEIAPESVAAAIARHRVEVLPATPSFLNLLLISGVMERHDLASLRVVPYGAEPMPAGLLARLRAALPAVDFVQRFGTTETGALPVRSTDSGLVLDGRVEGYEWKVVDGELWIHSAARALGYLSGETGGFAGDGWFRTGDLAEQRADGTVSVLGRRTELINVGGEKVLPAEVEGVLLAHESVADCLVYPSQSPVLGQVVAAEVVWRGAERDALEVKHLLHQFGRSRLARHKLPTVVRLVQGIAATRNLKKTRFQP